MTDASDTVRRLVACQVCGAPNAFSRLTCGRCHRDLSADPDGLVTEHDPPVVEFGEEDGPSGILVVASVLAVLAALAVIIALLSARGIGPLGAETTDVLGDANLAEVVAVQASSVRRPADDMTYDAEHVLDANPSTAWVAEDGGEPWIELQLAEPADVKGLTLWNGNQAEGFFSRHDRIATLRIEAAADTFEVDLLDARGPLAVDLPEPIRTDRLRLVAETRFSGDEIAGAALSRVAVRLVRDS